MSSIILKKKLSCGRKKGEANIFKLIKSISVLFGVLSLAAFSTNSYFSSQVVISGNTISTGTPKSSVVINEVYAFVAPHKGMEGKNEWIELYNPFDKKVKIKNWTITTSGTNKKIKSNAYIPAKGFLMLSHDGDTWSKYWKLPKGVKKVNLGKKPQNWLAAQGDHIILKNNKGNIVDQISFGSDISILNPSIPSVLQDHSIERSPLGFDSDQAGDFVDRTTPTPGS